MDVPSMPRPAARATVVALAVAAVLVLLPVRAFAAGTTWLQVSTGWGFTCGVQSDRTLWCWGLNRFGQLGLGGTTNRNQPIRLVNEHKWIAVAASPAHSCGIGVDGRLACWGLNSSGELGVGDTTNRTTPVLVG